VFPTEQTGGVTQLPRSGAFFGDTLGESEALVENAGGFAIERTIGTVNVNAFVASVAAFDLSLFQRLQQQDADQSSEAEIVVVEVAVTDSGCGIDKADALRLFEAFQQVRVDQTLDADVEHVIVILLIGTIDLLLGYIRDRLVQVDSGRSSSEFKIRSTGLGLASRMEVLGEQWRPHVSTPALPCSFAQHCASATRIYRRA